MMMVKSDAQILEPAINLQKIHFQKNAETNFSVKSEAEGTSIAGKISEKFDVRLRFKRLKKRMRSRSSNIL
ncbi:MAG: hypothetical protein ACR2GD_13930 [Pyrinomonadaceae bacterium]